VAIAAVAARSVALAGFGLDSLIERVPNSRHIAALLTSMRSTMAAAATADQAGAGAWEAGWTRGSAAVVEGHLVAVGVGERESAAERPVDGR
jgi:hypothetical protein